MIDIDKISIKVKFPEYERDYTSEQSEIDSLISKYNAGFYTLTDVITELYPNFTANKVELKVQELRQEERYKEKLNEYDNNNDERNMEEMA